METITNAIQDDYPEDFAWCYGCGYNNPDGYHLRTGWQDGHANQTLTTYQPRKEHTALPGFVYGGLLASMMDCHGTGSAALALHRKNGHEPGDGIAAPRFVTASLKIDFLKPTPHGTLLQAIGNVEEIHPKKFKVYTEIRANNEVCCKGEVIAAVMPDTFKPS